MFLNTITKWFTDRSLQQNTRFQPTICLQIQKMTISKHMKFYLILVVAFLFGVNSVSQGAPIQGFDLASYAKQKYGQTAKPILVANNAYGWRISYRVRRGNKMIKKLVSIDMQDVAVTQYGPGSTAVFDNFNDPYSWRLK